MSEKLSIDYAVCSEQGNKEDNADAADARIPGAEALLSKGIAVAIADGMSSSEGGKEASQVSVTGFLSDYFSTPESWTVKTSVTKILGALNQWLFSQGQMRYGSARGMVTTFSGLVLKSSTAHLFHVGDTRVYRYQSGQLEQLTRDHRIWIGKDRDFLSRAMGVDAHLDVDYRSLAVEPGDVFLFTTDGLSGHLTDNRLTQLLAEYGDNLQACANAMVAEALQNGSQDNVTCQLLRVVTLPVQTEDDILQQITELPFPPDLTPGVKIDGYEILRELHASKRSEVFLARDQGTGSKVILKTPSVNYRDEPAYLDSFLQEEWIGRRINNTHVLRVLETPTRRFLYNISEYVEGQSLRQWMLDRPQTDINIVRDYLGQITEGLRAFHRLEMIHLDLKPENILINDQGILKIIDFGSTRVAGVDEIATSFDKSAYQGTVNYSAPECLDGSCSNRSDIFSLAVIAYELLTGKLPFGSSEHFKPASKLLYQSARQHDAKIPRWVDGALRKALAPNPKHRYDILSEFLYDMSHPNKRFLVADSAPLIERNPLGFWKGISILLLILNLCLGYLLLKAG